MSVRNAEPRDAAALAEGVAVKDAVQNALCALERAGVPACDADEFIRDCVFEAWWDWDYARKNEPLDKDLTKGVSCQGKPKRREVANA